MKQVSEGVYFIEGQDEFLPDSHSYVIGNPNSGDLTLIDPGLHGKGNYKIRTMEKLGLRLKDVKRVVMTHTHFDHIGGLPEIQKAIPEAELWIHKNEGVPIEEGDERHVYGMEMLRSMCQSQFGIKPGAYTFTVHRKLVGGEELEFGGMTWEVIHIPGHSSGSIGLYNRTDKILIPGDVVYSDYAIGRFDLHEANGAELKESLYTLGEFDVKVLLPGHNRIMEDVKPGYVRETARQWEALLV